MKLIKRFLVLALIALVIIQFISIDKTNPPTDPAKDFITMTNPPANIGSLIKSACYDCHSNHTEYPWYTNVQPVAWWVKGHIKNGRKKLNFSEWGDYSADKRAHKIEENIEEIEERHMPLKSYTWSHADAKLSDNDVESLMSWFRSIK